MSNFSSLFATSLFDGQILAPVIASLGFVSIPLVAILTKHQRQMAEIIHGRRREDLVLSELAAVKAEVDDLRSQLRSLNQPAVVKAETDELTRRLG